VLKDTAEGTIPREKLFDFEQTALEVSAMSENILSASTVFYNFLSNRVEEARKDKRAGHEAITTEKRLGELAFFHDCISSHLSSVSIFLDYAKNAAKKADVLCGFIEAAISEAYKKEAAEVQDSSRPNPTDANQEGRHIIPQRRRAL
jgi:hypothetical protein